MSRLSHHLIELRQVKRQHMMGGVVVNSLAGVSLSVKKGECLAVTGPSGCGKSSLLNVLGLLDSPTSGSYQFAGQDTQRMTSRGLARMRWKHIGFVFQQFHLLSHLSALDNVALPLLYSSLSKSEIKRKASVALEEVGLLERACHRPNQLSGGQCQRVAIARALVCEPHLLLADEPTGALDSVSGQMVMKLMLSLHLTRQMTLILVTHDAILAQRMPRCVRLVDGVIDSDVSQGGGPHD